MQSAGSETPARSSVQALRPSTRRLFSNAPTLNRTTQVAWAGAGTSFGRVVAVSAPLANGTRRLFVAEPSNRNARGRVLIYSIR